MHRIFIISLVIIMTLSTGGFAGQEGTLESLSGKRVKENILFSLDESADKPEGYYLRYRIDNKGNARKVGAKRSFLATDDILLAYSDFNPLKYLIVTKAEEFDDPAFLAIQHFLELLETGKKQMTAIANTKDANEPIEKELKKAKSGPTLFGNDNKKMTPEQSRIELQCREPLDALLDSMNLIDEVMHTAGEFPVTLMEKWQQSATGLEGVVAVREEITNQIKAYEIRLKTINDLTQQIAASARNSEEAFALLAEMKQSQAFGFQAESRSLFVADCQAKLIQATALSFILAINYKDGIEALNATKRSLQNLNKSLKPYTKESLWLERNNKKTDYVFYEYITNDEKGIKLDLTVSGMKLNGKNITFEEEWSTKTTLRLRRYQRLVPEIGAGLFYTPLEIPKYGTKEVDGQTVIADGGTERLGAEAVVFFDLVWRWQASTFVYPMFQIGVGLNSNSPSLAAGLGLRFTKLDGLAITGGYTLAWYKDLETLNIGDPVTGTAEIEKDLRTTTGSDWYVAILYTWTIGEK